MPDDKLAQKLAVKNVANRAAVYQDERGDNYRIQYCLPDCFCILDEETGDEYNIYYEDIELSQVTFFELVPIK